MARKLYIKTFGCQMNEYDSAKMVDVLREAQGLESTDDLLECFPGGSTITARVLATTPDQEVRGRYERHVERRARLGRAPRRDEP